MLCRNAQKARKECEHEMNDEESESQPAKKRKYSQEIPEEEYDNSNDNSNNREALPDPPSNTNIIATIESESLENEGDPEATEDEFGEERGIQEMKEESEEDADEEEKDSYEKQETVHHVVHNCGTDSIDVFGRIGQSWARQRSDKYGEYKNYKSTKKALYIDLGENVNLKLNIYILHGFDTKALPIKWKIECTNDEDYEDTKNWTMISGITKRSKYLDDEDDIKMTHEIEYEDDTDFEDWSSDSAESYDDDKDHDPRYFRYFRIPIISWWNTEINKKS